MRKKAGMTDHAPLYWYLICDDCLYIKRADALGTFPIGYRCLECGSDNLWRYSNPVKYDNSDVKMVKRGRHDG